MKLIDRNLNKDLPTTKYYEDDPELRLKKFMDEFEKVFSSNYYDKLITDGLFDLEKTKDGWKINDK